jgi:hypothetical protein
LPAILCHLHAKWRGHLLTDDKANAL